MALAVADQLPLPTMDAGSRLQLAAISTRRKTVVARNPAQDAYIRAKRICELGIERYRAERALEF